MARPLPPYVAETLAYLKQNQREIDAAMRREFQRRVAESHARAVQFANDRAAKAAQQQAAE